MDDRHSHAEDALLLSNPEEIARREAENGIRQFNLALEIIRTSVKDRERPFKLRAKSATHLAAYVLWKMNWIHPFADGNGRTARAVSYAVMSIKLDSLLPGTPTIPEQIAADKQPYYKALERADKAWTATEEVDVSALEAMLNNMLATQLLSATKEASGEAATARY